MSARHKNSQRKQWGFAGRGDVVDEDKTLGRALSLCTLALNGERRTAAAGAEQTHEFVPAALMWKVGSPSDSAERGPTTVRLTDGDRTRWPSTSSTVTCRFMFRWLPHVMALPWSGILAVAVLGQMR
jgi:hypothetical protein